MGAYVRAFACLIIICSLIMISLFNVNLLLADKENYRDNNIPLERYSHDFDDKTFKSRGARGSLIESTIRGGSWLDSFEDDLGIDSTMSDHLDLVVGDVTILNPYSHVEALWHFDENSGTTAYDSTVNKNDCILGGDGSGTDLPTWTVGKFGNALKYEIDDFIDPGNVIDTWPEGTISTWVNFSSTSWTITGGAFVYCIGDSPLEGSFDRTAIAVHTGYSDNLQFGIYTSDWNWANSGIKPATNVWYHVAGSWGSSGIKIYINGTLKGINTNYLGGTPIAPYNIIGAGSWPDSGINGTIDEVSIFKSALNDEEIKYIYDNGTTYTSRNLANLTSKPIDIPGDMQWHTIIINKTQPENTFLNITIFDASNNQQIPGSPIYLNAGEFDISYIDSTNYPSIKLNATFKGCNRDNPILHYWGVSWLAEDCWRDTFFGGEKINQKPGVESIDGNAQLSIFGQTGLIPDDETVALWHFNEGSGNIAYDSSPNNQNVNINGATWTNGRFGNALWFDGVDDNIELPSGMDGDPFHDYFKEYSVEIWFNPNSVSNRQVLYQEGGLWNGINMYIYNGKLYAGVWSEHNGYDGDWLSTPITPKWHYGAAVYSVAGNFFRLYLDGELEKSIVDNGEIDAHDRESSIGAMWDSSKFENGDDTNTGKVHFFNGIIDELAVHKRALTTEEISINRFHSKGTLISKSIALPPNMTWNTLIINKFEPDESLINITVLDPKSNQPIENYNNLSASVLNISSINPHDYKSIKLKATFDSDGSNTPVLYDWSINWTSNKPPKINKLIVPKNSVYRTNSIQIIIDVSDFQAPINWLTIDMSYRSPINKNWQDLYLSNLCCENKSWVINFTPEINAVLGYYTFRVSCADSFDECSFKIFNDVIEVLNNPPTKPNVTINPEIPTTIDDLRVHVTNVTDIEDETISYYYDWYKNSKLQPKLTTELVPANCTFKNEHWKCIVTPNDGIDNGTSAEAEIIIQNTPPEIITEDIPVARVDKLFEFQYNASDIDDSFSELTWILNTSTNWLEIESTTGKLSGVPTYADLGWHYVNVTVFDVDGDFDWQESFLGVIEGNEPPVITTKDNETAVLNESYEVLYNAIDDQTPFELLSWFLKTNASWLKIGSTTGLISGTPTSNNDIGWYWVNVSVFDGDDGWANHNFTLQVIKRPLINNAPELSNPEMSPLEGDTNTKFTFSVHYYDSDLDPPKSIQLVTDIGTYVMELESGKSFNGIYKCTIKLPEGEHNYYFTASDGFDTVKTKRFTTPSIIKAKETSTDDMVWIVVISIIIVIILLFILFLLLRRKRGKSKSEAKQEPPPLIPTQVIAPQVGGQTLPVDAYVPPYPATTYATQPPVQPPVATVPTITPSVIPTTSTSTTLTTSPEYLPSAKPPALPSATIATTPSSISSPPVQEVQSITPEQPTPKVIEEENKNNEN